jgi:hypothetical protein
MARRRTVEERYHDSLRKQRKILEEFVKYEYEWSGDLLYWYRLRNEVIPDDEYRACAFFQNKEYRNKPGSLTLLYQTYVMCNNEIPNVTKETAFDILSYKYKMYAKVLETGGY